MSISWVMSGVLSRSLLIFPFVELSLTHPRKRTAFWVLSIPLSSGCSASSRLEELEPHLAYLQRNLYLKVPISPHVFLLTPHDVTTLRGWEAKAAELAEPKIRFRRLDGWRYSVEFFSSALERLARQAWTKLMINGLKLRQDATLVPSRFFTSKY